MRFSASHSSRSFAEKNRATEYHIINCLRAKEGTRLLNITERNFIGASARVIRVSLIFTRNSLCVNIIIIK